MKRTLIILVLTSVAFAQEGLNNDAVIKMAQSGVEENAIVSTIQRQPGKYSTTKADLVMLKQLGVSQRVIDAMLSKGGAAVTAAPSHDVPVPIDAAPVVSTVPVSRPAALAILKEGTEVKLKFAQELSSKKVKNQDRVKFVLDQDLVVGNTLFAKAGAPAQGTITHVKKAGMMGKRGQVSIDMDFIETGSRKIKLRSAQDAEGQGRVGVAVAFTFMFGPVGLITRGADVKVAEGTPFTAYVAEDITLR